MHSACGKPDDLSFGPAIAQCQRSFDFTLWFEELVLAIIPSTLFIVCAVPRLWYLHTSSTVTLRDALHKAKLVLSALLVTVQCVLIVETTRGKSTNTSISICAATLLTAAAILLCLLSHHEHLKSIRPAALLITFLSLTTLFDGVRIRTHFSIGNVSLVVILGIGAALKLLLLLLESKSKKRHVLGRYSEKSPEEFAGPISRTFFYWLHPLLRRGYKDHLSIDDIGNIDGCLFSSNISSRLSSTSYQGKKGGFANHGLTWLMLRCLGRNGLYPVVPRLALSAFTFAQPFLVNAMLSELNDHNVRDKSAGYGLIGATLLVYVGIAVSNAWYWQQINRSITIVRGSLVILLFDKLLRLKEDASVESRAMTLMFSDTQRIMNTLNYVHELWAGILETAAATWLLYRQTGSASFAMLGVSIVSSAGCISLSKTISRKQQTWLAAVDQRLGSTKRMLSSLKAIKMLSAGERTMKALNHLRRVELRASWPFRRLRIVTVVLSYSTMTLSPPIVFAVYIGIFPSSDSLNVTKLFTSLTLISLLATPLMHLCQAIPAFGAAHGCLKRIQSFLEIEGRQDPRSFDKGSLSNPDENIPGQTTLHSSQNANNTVLSLQDASFGWTRSKALLTGINLNVKEGSRIAIFGRVGCGKSLLFKGLLGEAEQIAGAVKVKHNLRFAYSSQTPWLENLSVEANLKQYATDLEDPKVLDSLIHECSLRDLINLPDYQAGTIGSGGVKLSGGQRQRLALARCLALKRDVLLLDDVFSALDRRTRLHIARNLLRPSKSDLVPMTIIYATHDKQIASLADKVYEITESGTLEERSDLGTIDDTEEAISSHEDAETSLAPRTKSQSRDEKPPPDAKKLLGDGVVYKTYLQSMGLLHSILFLFIGASFAITFKFPDIWIQWWSAAVSNEKHDHPTSYWMSVYAVLEILPLVTLSLWIWHLFYNVVPAVGISLHGSLLRTVMTASFPFISSVDTGSIINRFNQDLMLVDSLLPFDLFNTVSELFVATIQVIFIAVASVQALAVLPVVVVVLYMIQHFYLRTSKQLRLLDLEAKAVLHTKVSDVSGHSGPSMIRAHGWQDVTRKKFMEKLDASQKPIYLLLSVQRWLQLVLNLVVAGLVVIIAGAAVAVKTKVNVGAVGVAFLNAATLGETLTQFVLAWTSLETSLGAIARIALFERDTPSEQDVPSPLAEGASGSAWWPSSGDVVFDNVWATYDSGSSLGQDSHASWSLRGVSFKVRAGEHVTICGRTGSGKSTMLLALLRMVDVPMGSIYVDNVDHSQLPLSVFRKGFFVISQDLLEESVSLRQQLDPDGAFSDREIEDVLIQCGLWPRVDSAGGLSSTTTGMKLSVGEMQLLSLAKTLLYAGSRDGGIVILDEATSNLDRETQQKIDSLVDSKLKNKTIISVSHRLTSALDSDRIIIMENGQIIHDAAPSYIIEHAELFSGVKLHGLKEE